MNSNLYTGIGTPVIRLLTGEVLNLPHPQSRLKDGLRVYSFEPEILATFRTESNRLKEIDKRYIFTASLKWEPLTKVDLHKLFNAQGSGDFWFKPNADKELEYLVRVEGAITHRPIAGDFSSQSPGYSVELNLRGVQLLAAPGYGALDLPTGYGTDYGTDYGSH